MCDWHYTKYVVYELLNFNMFLTLLKKNDHHFIQFLVSHNNLKVYNPHCEALSWKIKALFWMQEGAIHIMQRLICFFEWGPDILFERCLMTRNCKMRCSHLRPLTKGTHLKESTFLKHTRWIYWPYISTF